MRRVGGWLTGRSTADSKILPVSEELAAVEDASNTAAWVMNDEVEKARAELAKGTSPFHKLGYAATFFWVAALGFDQALITEASAALAVAEDAASEHLRQVQRAPSLAYRSHIYPPGTEYALCQALSQLMGAVMGIMRGSWSEGLKGINRLRKAYFTVHALIEQEKKYLEAHAARTTDGSSKSSLRPTSKNADHSDDDDDDDFHDAEDNGHTAHPTHTAAASSIRSARSAAPTGTEDFDIRTVTSDPIDIFVHSGLNMSWGIVLLVLSLTPPVFRHLLAMFSFKGDRNDAMRILWSASQQKQNIFGCIATLVVLIFNDVAIGLADILAKDAYPEARVKRQLNEIRQMYPDSQLWLVEESRQLILDRKLSESVALLDKPLREHFPQIQGIRIFERSLNLMMLHRFQECSESYQLCVKWSNWSHGMYLYSAAACHIELYRDLRDSDPTAAAAHAERAKELLKPVPVMVRKKVLLGKQLPFDAFIAVKLDKWEARALARGCDIVEAVGVSPIEELSYFWTGYRRKNPDQLRASIARLEWCENLTTNPSWTQETADEVASLAALKAAAYRNVGDYTTARRLLTEEVIKYSSNEIKSCPHPNTYPLPIAHYELAVCEWQEFGGEAAPRPHLVRCREHIEKASKWESYDMEDRYVVKIMAAKETLAKLGV